MTRSLVQLLIQGWILSSMKSSVLYYCLYLYFVESVDGSRFLVEPDPINLLQYILFCLSAFHTSWMPWYHLSSEVPNTVPCWQDLLVLLILSICMPSIPNYFIRMGILNTITNALLLLLVATLYLQNGIPEPYPTVTCMLQHLEYLLLPKCRTPLVLQDSHISIPLSGTCS